MRTKLGVVLALAFLGASSSAQGYSGFLYSGGVYTILNDPLATNDTPNTNGTVAYGINDFGHIVGFYGNSGVGHGFLYSGGVYTTIDDPLATSTNGTSARGINNLGDIVGTYYTNTGSQAFLYSHGGYTTLNATSASGINDLGHIIGAYIDASNTAQGFLYSGGIYSTLHAPLATGATVPYGINDLNQIVGVYVDANASNGRTSAFFYSGGVYTILNDPLAVCRPCNPNTFTGTIPQGINNLGQITGIYAINGNPYGFLYSGGVYTTLDPPDGFSTIEPQGINDFGHIVGGAFAAPGVPEPPTWAMMLLGFAGLGFFACRRQRRSRGLASLPTRLEGHCRAAPRPGAGLG